jgi:hypothetical protein
MNYTTAPNSPLFPLLSQSSQLCHIQNLTVKSTMFPHRNIYKFTWTSPDGKMHNPIDHILVDRRRHSLHYITLHSMDPKLVKMTVGCGISHTITKTHI